MKETDNITTNRITLWLFIIYLSVLTWIILLKLEFSFQHLGHIRNINLIPYVRSGIGFEKAYNVLIFIPFGVYISMLRCNWSFPVKIAAIASTSLLFEILQFIFAIGISDITDLINNTLGGLIGIVLYYIVLILFKKKDRVNKIINTLASISTVSIIALFSFLLISNM